MNILLIDGFKKLCNDRLRELIDFCYISVKELDFPRQQQKDAILVCGIYCPPSISQELFAYRKELELIGHKLQIDRIYVLEIEPVDLHHFRQEARMNDNIEAWRIYLEMQYLF